MSKKNNSPSGERGLQDGTNAPADGAVERAESDAQAARAEDRLVGNDLVAVVGVGSSAGGLEAFRQLLKSLPDDTGMAIVLVTHLDPKHDSILPELIARATTLPVSEAQDGARVEPN